MNEQISIYTEKYAEKISKLKKMLMYLKKTRIKN